jgi:type IV pilus assembly protein PilB
MNIEAFLVSSTAVWCLRSDWSAKCVRIAPKTNHSGHTSGAAGICDEGLPRFEIQGRPRMTECNFLGYRGRIAVFELLTLNDQVKDAVLSRKSS